MKEKFLTITKKPPVILLVFSLIFLAAYVWLSWPYQATELDYRFDWPDETANYYWIGSFAENNSLSSSEPLNSVAKNQIHPRSFNVSDDGSLLPGSFLGLIIIFGVLAKFFTVKAAIFFTPVISIIGVWAFYGLISEIFGRRIGLISACLMFFHPAWWYYSVTGLLPNVFFVSLLLVSCYFFLSSDQKIGRHLLSALTLGLALSIRPTEIIWILLVYLAILIYLWPKLKPSQLAVYVLAVPLVLWPSFLLQQSLYGSVVNSGYSQLQSDVSSSPTLASTLGQLVLPFGFHPRLALMNLWSHFFSRIWWFSLLGTLGLLAFLVKKKNQSPVIYGYIFLCLVVFAYLVIYYGSWEFTDKLTVALNTLGLSYVRYWLPLFLLSLPFVAIGISVFASVFKGFWQVIVSGLVILLLFIPSARLVLNAKPDSLLPVKARLVTYYQIAQSVIDKTEPNSVIIAVRKDKLFFPERRVIHTFEALSLNEEIIGLLPDLLKSAPVYYYALGSEPKTQLTPKIGLKVVAEYQQEILYQVVFAAEEPNE